MQTLRVNLGPRSYEIVLNTSDSTGIGAFVNTILPHSKTALVVTDSHLESLAEPIIRSLGESAVRTRSVVVPAGETSKSFARTVELYDQLAEMAADRRTVVVAVGGGVIGDLAGFAAATYNRGLPLVMVPTSLLAMVDSSVGGKVGVNHPRGKNLIGAFHQPGGVWLDLAHLHTLPPREFRSGLAEVVKYGVILDPELFAYMEAHVDDILNRDEAALSHLVARSCRLKADVVEQDEREETGLRAILNYGHTFAHAFETVGGYGAWLHGEAVAAGMVCASRLAERLNRIPESLTAQQRELLKALHLPIATRPEWSIDAMIDVMRRDKKTGAGRLRFVLPDRMGHVELVDDVPEAMVREVLQSCG